MHTIKVAVLLILTLAVMRGASWLVGSIVARAVGPKPLTTIVVSNVAGVVLFAVFLLLNQVPGTRFDDYPALLFGAAVYMVCGLMDLAWRPWGRVPAAGPSS